MSSTAVSRELLAQFVVDMLAQIGVKRAEIVPDALFDDLGVDSLDVTELGAKVKREFEIDLVPRDFEDALRVEDALAVIYAKAGV
jgi:acyl carrier protein